MTEREFERTSIFSGSTNAERLPIRGFEIVAILAIKRKSILAIYYDVQ